jgi:glycosyltransferase involved in cell wall biosynthesis
MMFTRHPSYLPFELMASGCLVISNLNSATSWLLRDGENCLLALASANCIADTIARALQDHQLRRHITTNALQIICERFANWDQQTEHIYRYMCDPEAPT